jgi:hypothetical protein
MSPRRSTWTLALAAALTAGAAHGDDRATAQQLFTEGKALMAAGKVADACPKFAAAADLSATAGVRLNLGDCLDKLGRTASAWTRYGEALSLAEKTGDAAAAGLARNRLDALKPRLSYLVVKVAPDSAAAELTIERDGQPVQQPAWGTPVPVDPGAHEVKATAAGRAPWTMTVSVTTTGEQVVTVPVLAPVTANAGPASSSSSSASPGGPDTSAATWGAAPEEPQRSGLFSGTGGSQRVLAVAGAALGVAGLAVGSYFGATMLARKSDYQKNQGPNGACLNPDCQTASHDAISAGNVATVAFIAGGVLLGAGAVLWLTAPRESSSAPAVALAPLVAPSGAGIGATGSW